MRKIVLLILCFSMILSMIGCDNGSEDTISCSNCGKQISMESKFCPKCGTEIKTDELNDNQKENNQNSENEVIVSTVQELFENLKSDTKIVLSAKLYNLSNVEKVNNSNIKKDEFSEGYVISNISNLSISGNAEIVIDDIYADVLRFSNCSNIVLSGLTVGHTTSLESYSCEGDVIKVDSCSNFTIDNCKLYGCGATGLSCWNSQSIAIENSDIYDCSYAAINMYKSDLNAKECDFYDMSLFGGLFVSNSSKIKFAKCTIRDISCENVINNNDYGSSDTTVSFEDCVLENSTLVDLAYKPNNITFNGGQITNNIGNVKQNGVTFNNCNISNNSLEPAITIEYIDWDINSANGVEPEIQYTNNSNKQIAYIYFTIKFYDRMGYPAYCSIRDTSTQRLKVTGPIEAGVTKTAYWDPIIYNSSVGAIKPITIEVKFTDGSSQTIENRNGTYWYSNSYYGGELHD